MYKKKNKQPRVPECAMIEYQTGQLSLNAISKKYSIPKSTLSRTFNKGNVKPSEKVINAINSLNSGFENMTNFIIESKEEQEKGIKHAVSPTLVCEEAIKIIKSRNPYFANVFQNLSAKILDIANDLLDEGVNMQEVKDLTIAMKNVNDVLQVIPKPPAIAQQFNFDKNERLKDINQKDNDIKVNIKFE